MRHGAWVKTRHWRRFLLFLFSYFLKVTRFGYLLPSSSEPMAHTQQCIELHHTRDALDLSHGHTVNTSSLKYGMSNKLHKIDESASQPVVLLSKIFFHSLRYIDEKDAFSRSMFIF